MAYVITDECVSCGTCAGECPVEAIAEGDSHYEINPDVCVECGTWRKRMSNRGYHRRVICTERIQKRKSFADFLFLYIRFKTYREASSCRAFSFTIAFPCSSRNASAAREKDSCLPYSERMLQTLLNSSWFAAGLAAERADSWHLPCSYRGNCCR